MTEEQSVVRIIKIPYLPHQKQQPFHHSKAKFRAIITGVAFGKTAAGANEILKIAFTHPEALHCILAPNGKILKNATLPEVRKFGEELIAYERKSEGAIYLINGAKIVYLTADNQRHIDRLRGMTIGSFWADEAGLFLRDVWDVMLGRLRDPKGPLVGIITTTPRGFNWLYWYFVKKRNPANKKKLNNADQFEWFGGTTHDNPYTPEEFKQTLEDSYTGRFKEQEIYGKFVGFEGQVYSNFSQEVHIIKAKDVPEIKEYVFGVDWGFRNPLACGIIGFDGDGRKYLVEEFYQRGVQINVLIAWLKEREEKYHFEAGYGDPSEPQYIQTFINEGFRMLPADNKVMPGINAVYDELEVREDGRARLYVVDTCENAIDEFSMYRFKDTQEGVPQQDAPIKEHDHIMDLVRYVVKSHRFGSEGYALLKDDSGKVF